MSIPSYLSDLGTFLQTSGIGTLGVDIHYRTFKDSASADIVLIPAGGRGNNGVLSKDDLIYSPSLVINVKNSDAETCEDKANTIFELLNLITNRDIGTTRFKRIEANAPPFYIGQDVNGNWIYTINFTLEVK